MSKSPSIYKELKDLRHQKKSLWEKAKAISDKASGEGRAMNGEENGNWEKVMEQVDEHGKRIDALERMADADDKDEDRDEDDEEDKDESDEDRDEEDGDEDEDRDEDEDEEDEDEGERSFKKFIIKNGKKYVLQTRNQGNRYVPAKKLKRRAKGATTLPVRKMPWESPDEFRTRQRRSTPEYRDAFWHWMREGNKALTTRLAQRAIQADSDIVGGYLVAPQEFISSLIKFVNNYVFIRSKATVYTLKQAQSLGAPSLDTDPADADWTSELDTGNEDTSMSFGKRELTPRPLAKRIKVSNKLLRLGNISTIMSADGSGATGTPEALVRDRLAYKFAVAEEKAFLLGTGGNQPLGIFTASPMGVDTSRDVQTAGAGALVGDDLINAKYNMKVQYWPRMEWIFNRTVLNAVRKLKDSYGQYLWVPGGFGGESDTLLDVPVNMSEYAPGTIASGDYVAALFDPEFYWIADSLTMQVQRLVELYAAADQTGFIARMELDGMPVLAEAFTRVKVQ